MFRYLDKQPLASTLAELQAQIDAFDQIYNTERPHQGLPGRVTPQTAWEATPKAEPPRPKPKQHFFDRPAPTKRLRPPPAPEHLPAGRTLRELTSVGTSALAGVQYMVGGPHGFKKVLLITDGDKITIAELNGEILIEHTRPGPGVTYVGNGKPRGPRTRNPERSPKS